jgi:hypothetical protein
MRTPLLTLALLACQGALAEILAPATKYSDEEVLDLLRENPWFLKRSSTCPANRLTETDEQVGW